MGTGRFASTCRLYDRTGGKIIGNYTVSTMVSEVGLRVIDPEIQKQLWDEARAIRKTKEGF